MTQPLCVVSVPAGHPYVRRVTESSELVVLPDPTPVGAPPGRWWPPVVLEPGWIGSHGSDADLLHLHFGLESFDVDRLTAVVDEAHRVGWPVVQTVHDLANPQLDDQTVHERQLDALLPLVDAVITLTPGAAAAIARRWDRQALVLPHPRLLADGMEPPAGLRNDTPLIGVHLKDLRPNVDGPGAVRALCRSLDRLRERGRRADGEVHLQRAVRDDAARDAVRALVAQRDDVVLLEHDRYDDAQLANSLSHLDVCLLPYRWGTHSGWLELCWDLGVAVAVPDVGFFVEQHDDATVTPFSWADDASSLTGALEHLLASSPPAGSPERRRLSASRLSMRADQDARTAEAHLSLYRTLVAERPAGSAS